MLIQLNERKTLRSKIEWRQSKKASRHVMWVPLKMLCGNKRVATFSTTKKKIRPFICPLCVVRQSAGLRVCLHLATSASTQHNAIVAKLYLIFKDMHNEMLFANAFPFPFLFLVFATSQLFICLLSLFKKLHKFLLNFKQFVASFGYNLSVLWFYATRMCKQFATSAGVAKVKTVTNWLNGNTLFKFLLNF